MTRLSWKAVFVLILIISFMQATLIHAGTSDGLDLPQTKINPGNFYYNFKRLWEKGLGQLMLSQELKISFHKSQLKARLAELRIVVDEKILSEVQRSSERFSYQAGILTNVIVKKDDAKTKGQLLEEFESYDPLLQKLRDRFEANSSFWMLIQHDINTLKILSERLK